MNNSEYMKDDFLNSKRNNLIKSNYLILIFRKM